MTLRIGGFATLLQVFDMPTSPAFYRDVLGFQVASEVPDDHRCDWVMLTLHGSELTPIVQFAIGARALTCADSLLGIWWPRGSPALAGRRLHPGSRSFIARR